MNTETALLDRSINKEHMRRLVHRRFGGEPPRSAPALTSKDEERVQGYMDLLLAADEQLRATKKYWDRFQIDRHGLARFEGYRVSEFDDDDALAVLKELDDRCREAGALLRKLPKKLRFIYPIQDYGRVTGDIRMLCQGAGRTIADKRHQGKVNIYYRDFMLHESDGRIIFHIEQLKESIDELVRRFDRLHANNPFMVRQGRGWTPLGLGGIAAALLAAGLFVPAGDDDPLISRMLDWLLMGGSFIPGLTGVISDLASTAVSLVRSSNTEGNPMTDIGKDASARFEAAARNTTGREESAVLLALLNIILIWPLWLFVWLIKALFMRKPPPKTTEESIRDADKTLEEMKEMMADQLKDSAANDGSTKITYKQMVKILQVNEAVLEAMNGARIVTNMLTGTGFKVDDSFLLQVDRTAKAANDAYKAVLKSGFDSRFEKIFVLGPYMLLMQDIYFVMHNLGSSASGLKMGKAKSRFLKHIDYGRGEAFDRELALNTMDALEHRMTELNAKNPTLAQGRNELGMQVIDVPSLAISLTALNVLAPDLDDAVAVQRWREGLIKFLKGSILLPFVVLYHTPSFVKRLGAAVGLLEKQRTGYAQVAAAKPQRLPSGTRVL